LILNALQAMGPVSEGARHVLITTRQIELNDLYVGVQDTGPGLRPETLSRLFEPFYTTKPNGMGMGLTICRSIVESHGNACGRLLASHTGLSFSLRSRLGRHEIGGTSRSSGALWQRDQRCSAIGTIGGGVVRQVSSANGQRGAKRQ